MYRLFDKWQPSHTGTTGSADQGSIMRDGSPWKMTRWTCGGVGSGVNVDISIAAIYFGIEGRELALAHYQHLCPDDGSDVDTGEKRSPTD